MSHLDSRAARNTRRLLPLAMLIGAALALPLNGYACGPDFPNRLLIDRNGTLLYMPEGNFAFEAGRLVPSDKQLPHWQARRRQCRRNQCRSRRKRWRSAKCAPPKR